MRRAGLASLLALAMAAPAVAASRAYHGGQFRYWDFNDSNDLRDMLYYVVPGGWHAQLEYWDFARGDDQLRPELGVHPRDRRRSVYTLAGRAELRPEASDRSQYRFWAGTDQVLSAHLVGRAQGDVIASESFTPQFVGTLGADAYWGSWNFMSASAIHDPRQGGLWTFPVRLRLANEANDWLQLTVAPADRRTIGWAADLKKGWLRLGVERNSRYDFTTRDNVIYTIGFEAPLPRRK